MPFKLIVWLGLPVLLFPMAGLATRPEEPRLGEEIRTTPSPPSDEDDQAPDAQPLADNPCVRRRSLSDTAIDETRRLLAETLCRATLWFDSLFGADEHPDAARNARGRVELSLWNSDYEGTRFGGRFSARVDLPNLQERLNAFVGRDDPEDFVEDRREGAAIRSRVHQFQQHESWLAGFGYSLPGHYRQRFDVRVGTRLSTAPKLFVQGRWRRNIEVGDATLWHLRQTVFWTNRDGFGTTSTLQFDRVLTPTMLLRMAGVGTISERAEGLDWRSHLLLFLSLSAPHAVALEGFARGETRAEVPLREYGGRVIYRRTLQQREWLFGEVFLGYSWPRRFLPEEREGSLTVGLGIELLFGRD